MQLLPSGLKENKMQLRKTKGYLIPIYFEEVKFDFIEHDFKKSEDFDKKYLIVNYKDVN